MIDVSDKKGIHVAVIPDGNRRYARKKRRPFWYGHMKGAEKLREVAEWCLDHPEIKMVSVYALSTENLSRSQKELKKLWKIYRDEFRNILNSKEIKEKGLRINIIGDKSSWKSDVRQIAKEVTNATKHYTKGILNILLAYGSQYEIVNAARKFVNKSMRNLPLAQNMFNEFLLVDRPVDLLIRTGGEHRISNFLLYQAAYAEIYFSKALWPEFSKREFKKILKWYKSKDRRMGH